MPNLHQVDNQSAGVVRIQPQQRRFAEKYIETKDTLQAYMYAYPERCEGKRPSYLRETANNMVKYTQGIKMAIQEITDRIDANLAEAIAWDRQKATQFLIKAVKRIEQNLDDIDKAKQAMQNDGFKDYKILKFVVEMTYLTSQSVKEVAKQLNDMYGLSMPEKMQNTAIQVIIQNPQALPDDVDG